MSVPTFGGAAVFGAVEAMTPSPAPLDLQVNAYPGVAGIEVLNNGSRGGFTQVSGLLTGATVAALASAEATMRGLLTAGTLATFVDQEGTSWPNVLVREFHPQGQIDLWVGAGGPGYGRRYHALLMHLS